MKIKYYQDADLLSLKISSEPYKFARQTGDVIVHFTREEKPVLIEVLNAKKFLKDMDSLVHKTLPKYVQKEVILNSASAVVAHEVRVKKK